MRWKIHILVLLFFLASSLQAQWRDTHIDDGDMAADLAEALTFQKYPTYPQYVEMMQYFAQNYPEICRLDTFGVSSQGRLLLAMKISDSVEKEEAEAKFFYTSSMHGDELLGFPLMLRLISFLLTGYGEDDEVNQVVDGLAIWINPLANPDGTYYPDNDLSVVQARRETADGTDMNREFPDPLAGEMVNDTAGRALETKAMMAFLQEQHFTMSANIHSGAEVVNYPWDYQYELHADDEWYRFVSREYADEARAVDPGYMALFEDGITNGAQWYRINGGRQDYVNYYLNGREVTLELSLDFRMDSELLDEYWEKNERSLMNYMAQCLYGIRGTVSDSESGFPLEARIGIPDFDQSYSSVFSGSVHGDFYRLIEEGSYDLVISAAGHSNDTVRMVEVENYRATHLDITLEPWPLTAEAPGAFSFRIFPNPAGQKVYIEPGNLIKGAQNYGPVDITILSPKGILLKKEILYFSGSPLSLDLEQIPAGPCFIRLTFGDYTTVRLLIRE